MLGQKMKIGPFSGTIIREVDTPSEKIVIRTAKQNYIGKTLGYILSVKLDNCPTFYYMKIDPLYSLSRYKVDATLFPSKNDAWCWLMKLRLNVGKEMASMIDKTEVSRVEEQNENLS